MRAADLVFVDSEGHRELLPEPIRSEAFTVYIGTPKEWFHEPEPRAEGPLRVVFFGIYTPLQGAPVIGEAIRLLDPDPAEVRFTMAGRGQDLARTKELAGDSPASSGSTGSSATSSPRSSSSTTSAWGSSAPA